MSNGVQVYENGDSACFLSNGTLTHGSRDLFSEGTYSCPNFVIARTWLFNNSNLNFTTVSCSSLQSFTKYRIHPSGDRGKTSLAAAQITSLFRTAAILIQSSARAQMKSTAEGMRGGGVLSPTQKTVLW